jgi:hypothetical protein
MKEDKCPACGAKRFPVYFNDEGRYKGVQYKRCMYCDKLDCIKDEDDEDKKAQ